MTKRSALTFILNDETKTNSYGFRVLNSGIDLSRLKNNPVMLDFHMPGNSSVIGKWENIRIEESLLLADAVFDEEDDHAKKIKGKVERGFLKGASLGLGLKNAKWELVDDVPTLMMCEAVEASIVSIPSNANALKLYDASGQELTDEAIKLSISNNPFNKKAQNMSKLKLSIATLAILGISTEQQEDPIALSTAIEKLVSEHETSKANLAALTKERDALQIKLTAINEASATQLVEDAILAGKITADKKSHFLSLAKEQFDFAKNLLDGIPAKRDLNAKNASGGSTGFEGVKSIDDFEKLSKEQKLAFKVECPEQYRQIFS